MGRTLEGLEIYFRRVLLEALNRCSAGHWGLFGQNDNIVAPLSRAERERRASPDASDLIQLGEEIQELRASLGLPEYDLFQLLLRYRQRRGANAPGEPQMARKLLAEIETIDAGKADG